MFERIRLGELLASFAIHLDELFFYPKVFYDKTRLLTSTLKVNTSVCQKNGLQGTLCAHVNIYFDNADMYVRLK